MRKRAGWCGKAYCCLIWTSGYSHPSLQPPDQPPAVSVATWWLAEGSDDHWHVLAVMYLSNRWLRYVHFFRQSAIVHLIDWSVNVTFRCTGKICVTAWLPSSGTGPQLSPLTSCGCVFLLEWVLADSIFQEMDLLWIGHHFYGDTFWCLWYR